MFPQIRVIGLDKVSMRTARLSQAEEIVRLLAQIVVATHGRALEAELSREPGPPVYPIHWTSQRQMIAFFLTNGFGAGIPTGRTGTLSRAWFVELQKIAQTISAITVTNYTPYRIFVTGERQQRYHRTTGWINEENAFAKTQVLMRRDFVTSVQQRFWTA